MVTNSFTGAFWTNGWNITFLWYFSRETPQVRPLDGFRGLMPENCEIMQGCFFGGQNILILTFDPIYPIPSRKRQNLSQNRQSEATVSKRESPNMSEITKSTTWKSACILSIQAETFHFILDRIQPSLASHRLVLSTSNVVQHATRSYPFYALNTSRLSYSASIRPS